MSRISLASLGRCCSSLRDHNTGRRWHVVSVVTGGLVAWCALVGSAAAQVQVVATLPLGGPYEIPGQLAAASGGLLNGVTRHTAASTGFGTVFSGPPVALISAGPAVAGRVTAFDPRASHDPDGGQVVAATWSVDGVPVASLAGTPPFLHVFRTPGPHTVSLVVRDETGLTGSTEIEVQVEASPTGHYWAWGYNGVGELGYGSISAPSSFRPVRAATALAGLAAGNSHTAAVAADGSVWTWGYNNVGQLGMGSTENRATPTHVAGLADAVAVAAGGWHTLALRADGTLAGWGYNNSGQVAAGHWMLDRPVDLPLAGVVSIAAGAYHSLAIDEQGVVWSWGANWQGQLGDGSRLSRSSPGPVTLPRAAVAIAAGKGEGLSSYALLLDGSVWGWGDNSRQQLRFDATGYYPYPVQLYSGAIGLAAGDRHALVVTKDWTVVAWGDNTYGQVGPGGVGSPQPPTTVAAVTWAASVAAGARHSLALDQSGAVWAWGGDEVAQASGTPTPATRTPAPIPLPGFEAYEIAVAGYHSFALLPPAHVRVEPTEMDFGDVTVGDGSLRVWQVVNAGPGPAYFGPASVVTGDTGDFRFSGSRPGFCPGDSMCGGTISFEPRQSGDLTVTVRLDAVPGEPVLTARGVGRPADSEPPVITIASPVDGESYALGEIVVAAYTCEDAASGVSTCTGPVLDGQPVDTASAGDQTFSVIATDGAGNLSTRTVSFSVTRGVPRLAWATPAPVEAGIALSPVQLNAAADVPGTFSYTPEAGTVLVAGAHTLSASFTPADIANYAAVTTSVTLLVSPALIDARTQWRWFQARWPSRHLALWPDGTVLAQTTDPFTLAQLAPATGDWTLFPGVFQNGASGVAPNPVIWAGPSAASLIGGYGGATAYRQDGTFQWRWDNDYGCCNVFGFPYLAVDGRRRRVLASLGGELYALSIEDGPPPAAGRGGQGRGLVTATEDVAYVAGNYGGLTKWDIAAATPAPLWSRTLGTVADFWNFSEGAVDREGGFVVTRAGNHASPYWRDGGIWRAGELFSVSSDGEQTWVVAARATTPPVIGRAGLIYVGGLPADGAPQDQLDGSGVVQAFSSTGQLVWALPTAGLPQDLLVGDDGHLYVLTGGTTEGRILVLDQATGTVHLVLGHLPAPWEMVLADGLLYVTGDAGVAAVPLPPGFAWNYDTEAPWPVRQFNNQRTSQRVPAVTALSVAPVQVPVGGAATLVATLSARGRPMSGRALEFTLLGQVVGSATTDDQGTAALAGISLARQLAGTYPGGLHVHFAGEFGHTPADSTADVTVTRLTPTISWATPPEMIWGTVLGPQQLNATADVPGTFVYSHKAGSVLSPGPHVLEVHFNPADSATYTAATARVTWVIAYPITVDVVTPNGGDKVFAGTPFLVQWVASGGVGGHPSYFDVALSTDSGNSYGTAICSALAGSASCTWASPAPATSKARVRVTAHDVSGNSASDASNADFTISSLAPFVTVTAPSSPATWVIGWPQTISWQHNLGAGTMMRLELTRDSGATWEAIATDVPNSGNGSGTYTWTVRGPLTTSATVRVSWQSGPVSGVSPATVAIVAPWISVTVPNTDGIVWKAGKRATIKWDHSLPPGTWVWVDVSRDGGATWEVLFGDLASAGTKGQVDWLVSGPATSQARVRVRAMASGAYVADANDFDFTIR